MESTAPPVVKCKRYKCTNDATPGYLSCEECRTKYRGYHQQWKRDQQIRGEQIRQAVEAAPESFPQPQAPTETPDEAAFRRAAQRYIQACLAEKGITHADYASEGVG